MKHRIITVALLAGGMLAASPAIASTPMPPAGVVKDAISRPCRYEDSINCYWDARSAGNGAGHSFYSIRVGRKVCTVYRNRIYNRSHGYCSAL